MMKHFKLMKAALILTCAVSLAGCAGSPKGEETNPEPISQSQSESPKDSEVSSLQTETDIRDVDMNGLLDEANVSGTIDDFQDGSFQVLPTRIEDNGELGIQAADGMEDSAEKITVSYGEGCTFEYARIDTATGRAQLQAADSQAIKKSTQVAVYGEQQDGGEIKAARVLILNYQ